MQMVQWEGGESVNNDDCGGGGEGGVVNRLSCQTGEEEMCGCVHRYVCVAAGLPNKRVAMRSWTFSKRKETELQGRNADVA